MTEPSAIDQRTFRHILQRNVSIPLLAALFNAVFFALLVWYLVSAFQSMQDTEEVLEGATAVTKLSVDMQTGLRGFLITGDEEYLLARRVGRREFEEKLSLLKQLVVDNPVQLTRLENIDAFHQEWQQYADRVVELKRNNQDYQSLVAARGAEEYQQISQEFADFQSQEREILRGQSATARRAAITSGVIYLLVSFLLTAALSWVGRRQILILSDSYDKSVTQLQDNAEELEKYAWQRSGQVHLAERCMGHTALPALSHEILDFLGHYVNAPVAALYVRDSHAGIFSPTATFGFSAEAGPAQANREASKSLVEQAAHSKRLIRLDEVPQDYIKIGTGLGNCLPRTIVLLPVAHGGQVNGVLELGFLQPPSQRTLDFLDAIASYVGDTLEMLINRARLQEALEETQQLNEELQSQQEELRSTNEELEEQHRALEESQATLENQKAELEQANEKLSDQATMLDHRNTELNAVQAKLEERARDLEKASQYKSEFLANMSHELRTPLNSSMILAKLLADNPNGNLTDEQVKSALSIYASGNDLLNLINDILDISKVEAGKLELKPQNVNLQSAVAATGMMFEPLAKEKGLELRVEVASNLPTVLYTDHQRLEQILKNLMANAIKFTERGRVELTVSGNDQYVDFAVTDTGIGIRPEQLDQIFEAFEQADTSISRRYGGTGLGLSISRDLAELLGGSISVTSTPGEGSVFTLRLPVTMDEQVPATPSVPVERSTPPAETGVTETVATQKVQQPAFDDDRHKDIGGQRSVLVIEDDPKFAKILYTLAHEQHYHCLVALNASEGLQMAAEFLPDAILLDIRLPDASGMSVLQKLKVNPITRHIPVHVVSATDQTETALQMGAMGYVIKPATREHLKKVFSKIDSKLTQKTKRVLLVEDDPVQREAVVQLIHDNDVEITAVATGEEAMDLLRSTIFDCMIIDLKLPDMQGLELLQNMSGGDLYSFPPVIVYTGRSLTRNEEKELRKYSRSIIIKGARSPERLLDEVTLFLHKVESELSPERQIMLKTVRGRDRALEGRRILLVDDDVRNVFALTGALEQKGAIVEIARDGFEALEQLDNVPDIDLVLMDIMMPGMDGLEATRRIRADGRFDKLPIIAITAKAMKDDQEACLAAGASDYMAKPIDIDRLYSLLRVWMPSLERI